MRMTKSALCAATAVTAILAMAPAFAANDSWKTAPGTNVYNTATNWNGGSVPLTGNTATFGISNTTFINFTAGTTTIGGFVFGAGSSSYTFVPNTQIDFDGSGVNRNSAAGNVSFVAPSGTLIRFLNSSNASAGTGVVNYNIAGNMSFRGNSNAGNANIQGGVFSFLDFQDDANLGSSTILADSNLQIAGNARGGTSNITSNFLMTVSNTVDLQNATVINNKDLRFFNTATAGNSTITTNAGGVTEFRDTSEGGTARFILNGTGIVDVSQISDGAITFGSIEGSSSTSSVKLGSKSLFVGNASNQTYAGKIEDGGLGGGAGGQITKVGSGTWTITGANNYSGGTTINGGTLAIAADNNLGAVAGININNGATLRNLNTFTLSNARPITLGAAGGKIETDSGTTLTVTSVIGGAGGLTKNGDGTLTLINANTYAGATTINAGSLQLGNGATQGSINNTTLVNITSEFANLEFNQPGAFNFTNKITGSGNVIQNGPGVLTLTSAVNDYTGFTGVFATLTAAGGGAIGDDSLVIISTPGVLKLNNSETIGALSNSLGVGNFGTVDLNNNTLTLSGHTDGFAVEFDGVISGVGGSLIKFGSYTQTLGDESSPVTHTYNGGTTVNGGTLLVNGSLVNDVTVNFGATFGGNVTVGRDLFNDSGTISPGNSPGKIAVVGNYSPAATFGSPNYAVDVLANLQDAPQNPQLPAVPGATHDFLEIGGGIITATNTRILMNPTGTPVATTGNGIEIVRVQGVSNTDDFFLDTSTQNSTNGFYDGFQYIVNAQQNNGPGGSDQFFLQTVLREELVANATILAAGRQVSRDCFRGGETTPEAGKGGGRAWVSGRYGTFEADASTGADFDNNYFCVNGGIEKTIGKGFGVGVRGGYASTDIDLHVVQGLATLKGDTWTVEGAVTFNDGPFYAALTGGYQSTDWDYDHALVSGGLSNETVDGVIGSLVAGYRAPLGGSSTLTFEGQLLFDNTDCGSSCFLSGTSEDTSDWEGRLLARYETQMGSVRPYLQVSLSDDFSDGQRVIFGNAISTVDIAGAVAGVNLGLNANLGGNWTGSLEVSTTQGLDSDVAGYQGMLGVKTNW